MTFLVRKFPNANKGLHQPFGCFRIQKHERDLFIQKHDLTEVLTSIRRVAGSIPRYRQTKLCTNFMQCHNKVVT